MNGEFVAKILFWSGKKLYLDHSKSQDTMRDGFTSGIRPMIETLTELVKEVGAKEVVIFLKFQIIP